ncbi:MAG: hypothetical protein J0I43_06985 [Microbacterium sp.]|uniref:hypothetical protein n=1 Tax=Microbacterium sp. TaxID=51671 RepID=UPI001ACC675D|nr:hypothetical protein [Microbacterium sp.]MBN9177098.1 hypothetical protein [Microbacterium sp.]
MTRSDAERPSLRTRVREAGGWYTYLNRQLIRFAGPASVGPYDDVPVAPAAERTCPVCGAAMASHTVDRSGPKPLLHCP